MFLFLWRASRTEGTIPTGSPLDNRGDYEVDFRGLMTRVLGPIALAIVLVAALQAAAVPASAMSGQNGVAVSASISNRMFAVGEQAVFSIAVQGVSDCEAPQPPSVKDLQIRYSWPIDANLLVQRRRYRVDLLSIHGERLKARHLYDPIDRTARRWRFLPNRTYRGRGDSNSFVRIATGVCCPGLPAPCP